MAEENKELKKERVLLAGVHTGCRDVLSDTTEETMKELGELAETAGAEVVAEVIQNKSELESGTYMGEGKLYEIAQMIERLEIDAVIFDDELSGIQTRNISDILGVKVIDRAMLILDIFAMRAKSGEGKLQVELAQLKYRMPRLRGLGEQMSRTGGGIGTRGPGETKLESDRRHIRRRINALEEEIAELAKHRELLRKRRSKDSVVTAALVGYTNAGKSTLLNALTDADVFAEDKLFATLDPTSRGIILEDMRTVLLVDTVGFIRKLPHHLVEAFKSTLEEAAVADVLLHVIDASNPQYESHIKVVDNVLSDIGAGGKPIIGVYNKCDNAGDIIAPNNGYDASVCISAKYKEGFGELLEKLSELAPGKKVKVKALIPYTKGSLLSDLHKKQKVISEDYSADGTIVELMVDEIGYQGIKEYIMTE